MKLATSTIERILVIIILTIFAGYQFMSASAPANPPAQDAPAPLNVGSSTQTKTGNINANIFAASTEIRSDTYCDSLGNNCFSLPLTNVPNAGSGIGYNQVWQALDRVQGVWYQNKTLQPIMVFHKNIWAGSNISVGISPTNFVNINSFDFDSDLDNGLSVIVPPNHYYRMNSFTANSLDSSYVYLELRGSSSEPYCDVDFNWSINGTTGSRSYRVYGTGEAAIGMNYDKDDWDWSPAIGINTYSKVLGENTWGGSFFDSGERGRVGYFDGLKYASEKATIDGYNSYGHIVTVSLALVPGTNRTITNKQVTDIPAGTISLTANVVSCGTD